MQADIASSGIGRIIHVDVLHVIDEDLMVVAVDHDLERVPVASRECYRSGGDQRKCRCTPIGASAELNGGWRDIRRNGLGIIRIQPPPREGRTANGCVGNWYLAQHCRREISESLGPHL